MQVVVAARQDDRAAARGRRRRPAVQRGHGAAGIGVAAQRRDRRAHRLYGGRPVAVEQPEVRAQRRRMIGSSWVWSNTSTSGPPSARIAATSPSSDSRCRNSPPARCGAGRADTNRCVIRTSGWRSSLRATSWASPLPMLCPNSTRGGPASGSNASATSSARRSMSSAGGSPIRSWRPGYCTATSSTSAGRCRTQPWNDAAEPPAWGKQISRARGSPSATGWRCSQRLLTGPPRRRSPSAPAPPACAGPPRPAPVRRG